VRNRREKRDLVERGHAHGILVYANGEPVGWCQYGPREELPRINYRGFAPGQGSINLLEDHLLRCFNEAAAFFLD
jgi:hypothetical protein